MLGCLGRLRALNVKDNPLAFSVARMAEVHGELSLRRLYDTSVGSGGEGAAGRQGLEPMPDRWDRTPGPGGVFACCCFSYHLVSPARILAAAAGTTAAAAAAAVS